MRLREGASELLADNGAVVHAMTPRPAVLSRDTYLPVFPGTRACTCTRSCRADRATSTRTVARSVRIFSLFFFFSSPNFIDYPTPDRGVPSFRKFSASQIRRDLDRTSSRASVYLLSRL